jgi:hypothetical protein
MFYLIQIQPKNIKFNLHPKSQCFDFNIIFKILQHNASSGQKYVLYTILRGEFKIKSNKIFKIIINTKYQKEKST